MDVLTDRTFFLRRTRTYARREAQWYARDADGFGGVIIRLWHGRRAGSAMVERDLYQVVETDPPAGARGRAFVMLNVTDPAQRFPYKVLVGRDHACTCDAGRARVPADPGRTIGCKHRDAVSAALRSGFWDNPGDD